MYEDFVKIWVLEFDEGKKRRKMFFDTEKECDITWDSLAWQLTGCKRFKKYFVKHYLEEMEGDF